MKKMAKSSPSKADHAAVQKKINGSSSSAGGFVAQLARSVGVYGRPIPRLRGGTKGKVEGSRRRKEDQFAGKHIDWQSPTPTFSDKERQVIANLEQYTAEGLQQLNESLRESCIAKMVELRETRVEQTGMEAELQEILVMLADSSISSQSAMKAGHGDRMFIKKVVSKYRAVVEQYEAQKQHVDISNRAELDLLRRLIVKLHEQMHMAQGCSKVLDDIERIRKSTIQVETLLRYHNTELRIVEAGSKQVLAKAQAHKDALFQALVGLEHRLLTARGQREQRSKELRVSVQQVDAMSQRLQEEEQAVLEREVVWLQTQLKSAQNASLGKDGYPSSVDPTVNTFKKMGPAGTAGEVSETAGLQVQSLQLQIDQLERELADVREDSEVREVSRASLSNRMRPPTATLDGRDRARHQEARAEELRAEIVETKQRLASCIAEKSSADKRLADKLELVAQIKALEEALEEEENETRVWKEKVKISSELDEIDNMLADRDEVVMEVESLGVIKKREAAVEDIRALAQQLHTKRAELRQELESTQRLVKSLIEEFPRLDEEQLEKMEESIKASISEASSLALNAQETQDRIDSKLPIAEGTVSLELEEDSHGRSKSEDEERHLEQVQVEHVFLGRRVHQLLEQKALVKMELTRTKALLDCDPREGQDTDKDHPNAAMEDLTPEHALRQSSQGGARISFKKQGKTSVTPSDVAELSAIWKMEQGEAPLFWIPSKALSSPLPAGWDERVDASERTYYVEKMTGIRTYEHPNDVKYRGIYVEVKRALEDLEDNDLGMTADALEAERLRLREVSASIEQQVDDLKHKESAMQHDHLLAAISQEESSGEREIQWGKRRDEVMKAEVHRLRQQMGLELQKARDEFIEELRVQLTNQERVAIRNRVESEEKAKLVAERFRMREKLLKVAMSAARREIRLEEEVSLQDERQAIRDEIMESVRMEGQQAVLSRNSSPKGAAVSALERQTQDLWLKAELDKGMRAQSQQEAEEEVVEYARYLGMDPEKHPQLIWVAHLALTAPLPAGWSEHHDAQGNVFFYCSASNTSTYEHPMDQSFKAYYSKLISR